MKYYVYNSRCQPLNNLIQAEIKWLADHIEPDDKIIIGIVNPFPSKIDPDDRADDTTRFDPKYNPLSYWERYEMLDSFVKVSGLSEKVAAIVPMPRPSVNMKSASNYLPERDKRKMCLSCAQQSETEDNKRRGMENQGEEIEPIPSYEFPDSLDIISPELIFCMMRIGNTRWTELVSEDVASYLDEHDILDRVAGTMKQKDAKEDLKKIYRRAAKADDKDKIGELLQGCGIIGVPEVNKKTSRKNPQKLQELYGDLIFLREEIRKGLPSCEVAPKTNKKFTLAIEELDGYVKEIDSGKVDESRMHEINECYCKVKESWKQEKK